MYFLCKLHTYSEIPITERLVPFGIYGIPFHDSGSEYKLNLFSQHNPRNQVKDQHDRLIRHLHHNY